MPKPTTALGAAIRIVYEGEGRGEGGISATKMMIVGEGGWIQRERDSRCRPTSVTPREGRDNFARHPGTRNGEILAVPSLDAITSSTSPG